MLIYQLFISYTNNFANRFDPLLGLEQVLPLQVKVDLVVMTKGLLQILQSFLIVFFIFWIQDGRD